MDKLALQTFLARIYTPLFEEARYVIPKFVDELRPFDGKLADRVDAWRVARENVITHLRASGNRVLQNDIESAKWEPITPAMFGFVIEKLNLFLDENYFSFRNASRLVSPYLPSGQDMWTDVSSVDRPLGPLLHAWYDSATAVQKHFSDRRR